MDNNTFQRTPFTWLVYALLAFYAYYINVIGPITPFLKEELGLSYTVSSLHYTAFALGMLLVGFGGHTVIRRIGRTRALWLGAFGMSLGALLLLLGRSAPLTIGAAFGMGLVGSLILVIVPTTLSDLHGEFRAVAIAEANVFASILSTAAPLMVGWTALLPGGWRLALGLAALAPFLMLFGLGKARPPQNASTQAASMTGGRLPALFWVYWAAIVLSVAVEFCLISWSADFLEKALSLPLTEAAKAVSLFLAAMIVGRMAISRLVQRFPVRSVVLVSILTASLGFGLFWLSGAVIPSLAGLFLAGLGVAGLYPLLLSLALGVAGNNTTQASARTTLASGTAILSLPLALGRLADLVGIQSAYAIVGVLLAGVFLIVLLAGRRAQAA